MKRALVTGASSGIGAALALDLARRGHDLLLVARDGARLSEIAAACERAHGVTARALPADLTADGAVEAVLAALEEAGGAEVLVNNAGFAVHGGFASTDLDRERALVRLQLDVMLALTKALLPGMLERKSGRILNVASVYSFAPAPGQAVYAACKAFMLWFSEALAAETRGRGVSVTAVCPGLTRTEFRRRAGVAERGPARGMEPGLVARRALDGLFAGRRIVVPGAANKLYALAARLLSHGAMARLTGRVNRRRGLGAAP